MSPQSVSASVCETGVLSVVASLLLLVRKVCQERKILLKRDLDLAKNSVVVVWSGSTTSSLVSRIKYVPRSQLVSARTEGLGVGAAFWQSFRRRGKSETGAEEKLSQSQDFARDSAQGKVR